MSVPIRVSDSLFRQAEAEARLFHRSPPRQIEFWAELGKRMAACMKPADYLAVLQGVARVHVEVPAPPALDADEVFAAVEQERLQQPVTQAAVGYEASRSHPGLVDRITPDGGRTPGRFVDGKFVTATG